MAQSSFGHGHSDNVGSSVIYAFRKIYTFTQQIYATVIPQSILRITHYTVPQSITRVAHISFQIITIMGSIGNNVMVRPGYVIATTLKPGDLGTAHESKF